MGEAFLVQHIQVPTEPYTKDIADHFMRMGGSSDAVSGKKGPTYTASFDIKQVKMLVSSQPIGMNGQNTTTCSVTSINPLFTTGSTSFLEPGNYHVCSSNGEGLNGLGWNYGNVSLVIKDKEMYFYLTTQGNNWWQSMGCEMNFSATIYSRKVYSN